VAPPIAEGTDLGQWWVPTVDPPHKRHGRRGPGEDSVARGDTKRTDTQEEMSGVPEMQKRCKGPRLNRTAMSGRQGHRTELLGSHEANSQVTRRDLRGLC
jgi:hypothetical protein